MAEPPKDPTNQELLERIVKLEADNAELRARHDDLVKGWKSSVDGTFDMIARIFDLLGPVSEKVFPHLSEMQSTMDAIVPPCYADPTVDTRPREYKRLDDLKLKKE